MTVADRVRDVVLPAPRPSAISTCTTSRSSGPVLKVVVDRPGGLDLDVLADATRAVSRALDEADPIAGAYTLEVTSPGLERRLRTPRHFARAVGETVKVKLTAAGGATRDGDAPPRGRGHGGRRRGRHACAPTARRRARLAYDDIERARTVFDVGPAPQARQGRARRSARRRAADDHHRREEGREAMSETEMMDALQALAAEKGISVDTLMAALADALESAYKRMPGAHEYAWVTIDPDQLRHPRLRAGDRRGRRALRPRARRHARRTSAASPPRRPARS